MDRRVITSYSIHYTKLYDSVLPVHAQELDLLPQEAVVTQHSTTIRGEAVRYSAEAGTLPIRREGKVTARMFYVAYARTDLPQGTVRPILFSFNGGPGTASVWMHMGYTGPRRVRYRNNFV